MFISIIVTTYGIDFSNNTGEKAMIQYKSVHDAWNTNNPGTVQSGKNGHIMVHNIH